MTSCAIDGCDLSVLALGLCRSHYRKDLAARRTPRPCSIDGCNAPRHARGWCRTHHDRWLRHGDALHYIGPKRGGRWGRPPCAVEGCRLLAHNRGRCRRHEEELRVEIGGFAPMPTLEERFWTKVDKQNPGECWLWLAAIDACGYAKFNVERHNRFAHRFAYELLVARIPEGMVLDHLCHTMSDCRLGVECPHRRCVNPAHLEVVTPEENTRRAFRDSCRPAGSVHV